LGVRDLASPAMVIAPALAYGGLVQLLAGMWEIAVGMCIFVSQAASDCADSFFSAI